MTEPKPCRCGKPSHPLYGSRCEDCYALGNNGWIDAPEMRPLIKAAFPEGLPGERKLREYSTENRHHCGALPVE